MIFDILIESYRNVVVSVIGKGTMLIGYTGASTSNQNAGLQAQERDLLAEGCEPPMAGTDQLHWAS